MGDSMEFQFRLSRDEARKLAAIYVEDAEEMDRENRAFDAGKLIEEGKRSKKNLKTIVNWKSPRTIRLIEENSEEDVDDALHLAIIAKTDRAAMAVLTGLRGVATPMASAILTAIFPERFTIIDFRALETLGTKKQSPSIDYYLSYLEYCRSKVSDRLSLRDFDRALWQWSKDQEDRS